MKKKVLSLVLTAAMMTTMLAGCGSSDNGSTAASTGEAPAAATILSFLPAMRISRWQGMPCLIRYPIIWSNWN